MKYTKPEIWAYIVQTNGNKIYPEFFNKWKIRRFGSKNGILGEKEELDKWLKVYSFSIEEKALVQKGIEATKFNEIW